MSFVLDGELPPYILAKDVILHIIGEITVSGATYKAMEFSGTAIESMTMEERMTLTNMVVEAGGKNGVIPPDRTTFDYVDARTDVPYEAVYSDSGAAYMVQYKIDVTKLEPTVAAPHSPDNRKLARECSSKKIDRVYIGSCTGGWDAMLKPRSPCLFVCCEWCKLFEKRKRETEGKGRCKRNRVGVVRWPGQLQVCELLYACSRLALC